MEKRKIPKAACILDPFSFDCFQGMCNLQSLNLTKWKRQLRNDQPALLLVASSTDEWKHSKKIIIRIMKYSQKMGIKTIFLCINEKMDDDLSKVCNKIYQLPMEFQSLQQDPAAIAIYRRRVNQLLKDRDSIKATGRRGFSIITCTIREHFIENVFENYYRQTWPLKELIIILNNDKMDISLWKKKAESYEGISVYQIPENINLGECLNYGIAKAKFDYIAKVDDDDYYGPYYLTDIMHAFRKSKADIVGKKSIYIYFERNQSLALLNSNLENCFVTKLAGACLVVKRKVFDQVMFPTDIASGSDSSFVRECLANGYTLYAGDKFNFAAFRRADLNDHTWKIKDGVLLKKSTIIDFKGDYRDFVTI